MIHESYLLKPRVTLIKSIKSYLDSRILDRFSPYSYCNNKEAYPEGARDFTLGESIWFALTSLTPQGGGECPKALSGRILVAAYWLFIVLMLATFTANLVQLCLFLLRLLEHCAAYSRVLINQTV